MIAEMIGFFHCWYQAVIPGHVVCEGLCLQTSSMAICLATVVHKEVWSVSKGRVSGCLPESLFADMSVVLASNHGDGRGGRKVPGVQNTV